MLKLFSRTYKVLWITLSSRKIPKKNYEGLKSNFISTVNRQHITNNSTRKNFIWVLSNYSHNRNIRRVRNHCLSFLTYVKYDYSYCTVLNQYVFIVIPFNTNSPNTISYIFALIILTTLSLNLFALVLALIFNGVHFEELRWRWTLNLKLRSVKYYKFKVNYPIVGVLT